VRVAVAWTSSPSRTRDTDARRARLARPAEDEVHATATRTRAALESSSTARSSRAAEECARQPGQDTFVRYTPGQQPRDGALKQRIIKMSEIVEDPLEPPRFQTQENPRGPPSPPPPVLRSPPRKATARSRRSG